MEYIEMAAAPKGMFDKIKDGVRPTFNANGPGGSIFRPVPLPVFSHEKPFPSLAMGPAVPESGSGSEASRRGGMPAFAATGVSTHVALVSGSSGNSGGMHLQLPPHESRSSLQGDDVMEKGKRSRIEGGRGSRGAGTGSRKRTRAGQSDSLTASEAVPEESFSGGAVASVGKASTGNGTRHTHNSSGDKAEKSSGRRQSGQGAKRGEKKQPQMVASALNEPPAPKMPEANGSLGGWNSGILDIYGLRTRPTDISRFMVDIPLNDLMSGNYDVPLFTLKDNPEKMEPEQSFEQQLDSALLLVPKRPVMGEAHSSRLGEISSSKGPKHPKAALDLESPLHPEEDGASQAVKIEKEIWSDSAQEFKPEVGADKEGSTGVQTGGLSSQVPSRFIIDDLPIYPFEDFMSRLSLAPSDSLQSLLAHGGIDGETSGSAENRTGGDVVDACRRNGSIPPLLHSYPPMGPLKFENSRYNHRIWIRCPTPDTGVRKGGSESSAKGAPNGAEEDVMASSPNSRRRRADKKEMVEVPDAMQVSISGTQSRTSDQVGPSRTSSMLDLSTSVKEEPRQVENAVGFSSEGNPNPMEIDSGRVDSSCVAAGGSDERNSLQAVNTGHERQSSGGDAVRPLETSTTAMDTSDDRDGKLSGNALAEVKQEKIEPAMKEIRGVACLEPGASRHETSLPPVDLKINIRSCSPPQNDSSSSLPVLPSSPGAQAAARLLCTMANSVIHPDQTKIIDGERERRRRGFQSYPGAPDQKTTKSIRVSNSTPGDDGREGRKNSDGGFVLPSKAPGSERRKSLSQVNDGLEKPSYSSPRNSSGGGGMSTGSRAGGTHAGPRSSNLAVKLEKLAGRESAKDFTNLKEMGGGGSSSLPPISSSSPLLKTGHKGVKTNSYVQVTNSKGSSAPPGLTKIPAGSTTHRVVTVGTSSRSSRAVHAGNSQAAHGPGPVPLKSSRQSIPESRQKKTEVSVRGGKPSRD